jgi:threonine dehydrogenase-like Zn-dependent dehydrogenase
MRAVAVVPGQHDSIHIREDVPEPEPSGDEALVRVLQAGVCGTDMEIHQGHYGEKPPGSPFLVLGHENLGVVESGPAGAPVAAGDLVVATVRRPCPEACVPCARGQNDMCLTGNYSERGIRRLHGFMSERYAEKPLYLIKVPAHLRPFAILLEPMGVVQKGIEQAYRVQERLDWEPRQAVVLGAGPVGILAGAALRIRGLEVTVVAQGPEGCAKDLLLRDAGMRYVSSRTTPIQDLPTKLGRIDLVFEATGAVPVIAPAMSILGVNGVCVLSSVTEAGKKAEIDVGAWNRDMVLGNRLVLGTVNAGRRHFEAGVRDLETAEERLPGWMERLITRRMPFTDAKRSLERPPDDIKTVLEFH